MTMRVRGGVDQIQGHAEAGYGAVADTFRRQFAQGREVGAACAVHRDGRLVVDLWGGYRDGPRRLPWERDTLVPVWSTTKGLASMTLAVANSRGLLDFDERVAAYWPEFAQSGKAEITIRQLLSHRAGLAALDEPISTEALGDPDRLAARLARQTPLWEPGHRQGYHAWTLGFYEGELLRRVDPTGRSSGVAFADDVATHGFRQPHRPSRGRPPHGPVLIGRWPTTASSSQPRHHPYVAVRGHPIARAQPHRGDACMDVRVEVVDASVGDGPGFGSAEGGRSSTSPGGVTDDRSIRHPPGSGVVAVVPVCTLGGSRTPGRLIRGRLSLLQLSGYRRTERIPRR